MCLTPHRRSTAQGENPKIELWVDRIAQQPKAEIERLGRTGSFARVWWSARACSETEDRTQLLQAATARLHWLAFSFACLNPRLTLALGVLGNRHEWAATRTGASGGHRAPPARTGTESTIWSGWLGR